jgi:hypothetical protein
MKTKSIQVPAALLLDPVLTPAAKLVWAAAAMGPGSSGLLAMRVALTRPTVRTGLARLAAAGWPPGRWTPAGPAGAQPPAGQTPTQPTTLTKNATLPVRLLEDPHIGAPAKLLYGILQLIPGRFTYAALGALTNTDPRALKAALAQLNQACWVKPQQENKHAPVTYTLLRPPIPPEVTMAQRRFQRATHKAEALMREFLTLLIDRDDYKDDDAPEFLKNPLTGQPLEADRIYPPDVIFEYNGPQHYRKTNIYSEQQARIQRARDFIKAGLCADNHVTLVVIHAEDLTLERMQRKVPRHLPRRDLAALGPLSDYLNRTAAEHRENAK